MFALIAEKHHPYYFNMLADVGRIFVDSALFKQRNRKITARKSLRKIAAPRKVFKSLSHFLTCCAAEN